MVPTQLDPHSQPFAVDPSQLLNPPLQVTSWQVPLAHDSVAFARLHATPQSPQLASVWIEVSQPSAVLLLQFLNPEAQLMAHWPAAHEGVPFTAAQTFPHAPQ